jgi:LPS-assembly protein
LGSVGPLARTEGKKDSSFSEEKEAKRLLLLVRWTVPAPEIKVFLLLFLQKKKILPALLTLLATSSAAAQTYRAPQQHFPMENTNSQPITGNQPVTFEADQVSYDKEHGLVTASGHVEAWQNDHIMRADRVTFDRNTNVVAAHGHVVIVEPDGQILFADYAELTGGMKNGVMTNLRSLMAENARMAANGGRRIEGKLNVMSRGVYTACNVCKTHPNLAPVWQLRAFNITQDLEHQRLEFRDAYLDMFGVPVMYSPIFSMTDPSVKRQSGFLIPSLGLTDEYLGSFLKIPYFYVINGQSDVTLTPTFATLQGPALEVLYEQAFNSGKVTMDGAIARDEGTLAGFFYGKAAFDWNNTWRYGADVNLGSSVNYLRDFQIPGYGATVLGSDAYIEGFGVGSWSKLSIYTFQGLNSTINQSFLPYVLPNYEYSYFGEPDVLGGRVSFDARAFNILRDVGTNDQQLGGTLQWNRRFASPLGDQWLFTAWASGAVFNANSLNAEPNFEPESYVESNGVTGQVQLALKMNWPFMRDAGSLGNQILEPIVQVIVAPPAGNSIRDKIPNEDSFDYEFTDSTLFSLNRFNGYDRYDGGVRVNFGLRGEWNFLGGQKVEGFVGSSWEDHIEQNLYPLFQPWNGFERGDHLSDIVGRASFVPNSWFDFTARARLNHDNGDIPFIDAIANAGQPILRVGAGFLYGATNPYYLYLFNSNVPANLTTSNYYWQHFLIPREEVELSASSHFGRWTIKAHARRDLEYGQMVDAGGDIKWENECLILDVSGYRRFTSINNDDGDTTILLTVVLKTIGALGFTG